MASSKGQFEPQYLCFLDELYHNSWTLYKKLKIDRLRRAIDHFWPKGHPSRFLQITGTNGKGTVAMQLEQGLSLVGKTGSWTGPHVFDYAERIRIGGQKVEHNELVEIFRLEIEPYQLEKASENGNETLGFASIGILLAMKLFERHGVEWGIMEVGAGGRYTPLMALEMAGCVLTNVGEDHPVTLGSEKWQRALDKAGIARPGVPFFSSEIGEAREYVRQTAISQGANYIEIEKDDLKRVRKVLTQEEPDFMTHNRSLSMITIQHFFPQLSDEEILGTFNQNPEARFWQPLPDVVVDVAHNPNKMKAFAQRLEIEFPDRKWVLIVGLSRKRNPVEVFSHLVSRAERVLITSAGYAGQDPADIACALQSEFAEVKVERDPKQALQLALDSRKEDELVVVTGSAYMIDQMLNPDPYLKHLNASFGWRQINREGSV